MKLKLSDEWTQKLLKMSESGMGYQTVMVVLRSGIVIDDAVVLNAEILEVPDEYSDVKVDDIVRIKVKFKEGR